MPAVYQSLGCSLLASCILQLAVAVAQSTHAISPTISWSACPSTIPPGVDCASIKVPLTYEPGNSTTARGNETVTLVMARLKATGNGTHGVLFINPGGPGVPATAYVAAGKYVPQLGFSKDVRENYDIIGLDPRGVGQSSPIKCNPDIFNERVATFVNTSRGYDALVDHNRRLGESCTNLTGPLINYLDSIHVAKDFDIVRRALGEDKFNYFGQSYGSLIGSQYLSLFPGRVGRMALDGLIDHTQSEITTLLTEATTYEATLNKFFEWCDRNTTCALHGNNTKKAFDTLLARADAHPIPAPACNGTCRSNVTGEDIRYNLQNYLEFVDLSVVPNWIDLGGAIVQALAGNATAFSSPLAMDGISNSFTGSPFVYLAIGCQDWRHRAKSVTDITQRLQAVKPFAPRTAGGGQVYYYQSGCLGWPAPVSNGQAPLNPRARTAPPVLLSNSVYDPACSIVWADGLRQQLPNAVSITRNGSGHTSHTILGETRAAIDNYLATGKLPKDGSVYQT